MRAILNGRLIPLESEGENDPLVLRAGSGLGHKYGLAVLHAAFGKGAHDLLGNHVVL